MKCKLLCTTVLLISCTLLSANYSNVLAQEAGYAGSEACTDCHQKEVKAFSKTKHGNKLDRRSPAASDKGCETCHGPMAKHVEAEGEGFAEPVKTSVCQECHDGGKVALWKGSTHEMREVNCTNCHNPHGGNKKDLVATTESEQCAKCHKDVRAELLKSSHHPIREGKMTCSDCHNPHGTVADNMISANTLNDKCYECHAEKRGPFLWEHPPALEDCSNCHVPHGSSYVALLKTRTPLLCQQCHSNARHPGTMYALDANRPGSNVYTNLNNRAFYRDCMNCHSQVHGSNSPSGKTLAR